MPKLEMRVKVLAVRRRMGALQALALPSSHTIEDEHLDSAISPTLDLIGIVSIQCGRTVGLVEDSVLVQRHG